MTSVASLDALRAQLVLGDVDVLLARALGRLGGEADERVLLAAALANRQVREGDVCLDLQRLCAGGMAFERAEGADPSAWPEYAAWRAALETSRLVGGPATQSPLVLDADGRVYLRRYFEHEQAVAKALLERARADGPVCDRDVLQAGLARLFPVPAQGEPEDLQRVAAERAVEGRLCVISGGPGTGKTSTVVKILALLVEQSRALDEPPPRFELLAPTGKAAARLSESIRLACERLPVDDEVRRRIRADARTLHRALGLGPEGGQPRHHAEHPLGADVVVVDEASMVDLERMALLLAALRPNARLILLGDRHQLASVEAGAVLGDICGGDLGVSERRVSERRVSDGREAERRARPELARCIVQLERSYRYGADTAIGRLAQAVVAGDADAALRVLDAGEAGGVQLIAPAGGRQALRPVLERGAQGYAALFSEPVPDRKLAALGRFRLLCALRRGPFGQIAVNLALEAHLRERGVIGHVSGAYASRPIIVTENDHTARLYNGDVGVWVREGQGEGRLVACFVGEHGKPRQVSLARIPPHESAYAMSVHKSQGSELDEVLLVLPKDPSPVLCRELLYTAITRARERVVIVGTPEIVRYAIERPIQRASGLRDRLWRAMGQLGVS